LSTYFIGSKDFSSYCKSSSETPNKICQVYEISWRYLKDVLIFYISADRFLHGMVRTILGTILEAAKQNKPDDYIQGIFEKKDRSSAGESVPAKGLFLYKVKYDN
jgi:tRNA pseudouridine38-40 synthase